MRLEWIEDLLAVMDSGSLSRAAEKRFSTQPAFSRRIRTIEEHIGVELLDRTRKPVQIKASLFDQRQRMQDLAAGLRQLTLDLKRQDRTSRNRIVIASQHAITTAMAPHLVDRLSDREDLSIRLRSANRNECLILLMTREADIILIYESDEDRLAADESFLERCSVGRERLLPVYASQRLTQLNEAYALGELPIIAYPSDVFLGNLLETEIFPQLPARSFLKRKAETALTPAALQLAVAGVGIAWVPGSLARGEIQRGALTDLSDSLPTRDLSMTALRLTTPKSAAEERLWRTVAILSPEGGETGGGETGGGEIGGAESPEATAEARSNDVQS